MADSAKLLSGKKIVVTRAPQQAGELIDALARKGAEVLLLPLVRFAPPEDPAALDEHLSRLEDFEAVIFLSANAVRFVCDRCREIGVAIAGGERFTAAVGPATARVLSDEGVRVSYVAQEHIGKALARELKESLVGKKVLLPRSDQGDRAVVEALREGGAKVTEVVAYRTAMPNSFDAVLVAKVLRGDVDAIIFASPSAVENFVAVFGGEEVAAVAKKVHFAAIGPTTAQSLRDASLPVSIQAADSSTPSLVAAVEHFLAEHP